MGTVDREARQILYLDTDYVITDATTAYLHTVHRELDDLVGENVFRAFPQNSDPQNEVSGDAYLESLESVKHTLRVSTMAPFRYDIETGDGQWLVKYWTITNVPVIRDGVLIGIESHVRDVTQETAVALLEERNHRANREYLADHPLAFIVGLVAFVSALILLLFPQFDNTSSLATILPDWAEAFWAIVYGLGGLGVCYGIAQRKPRFEAPGLFLLAGALLVDIGAIFSIRGPGGGLVSTVLLGVSVGAVVRATTLVNRYAGKAAVHSEGKLIRR